MKNFIKTAINSILIIGVLYFIFFSIMPHNVNENESLSNFSTERAVKIIETISKKPHFIGSQNHEVVADYLQAELQKLGLETTLQSGFSMSDWGNLTFSTNIIAKINGSDPKNSNQKALLLLSHYDSAPHSYSHGASDDASGLGTILEGLRAFLHNKTPHKNDIIILFTDAEEIGLNGAALFVTKHHWAKNIGLAINFEARGTAGPSFMLVETNAGNASLIKGFVAANPKFPAANSLMYSIYKMLPNDTDLTVFREQGKIQGFNLAYIDDHFNYHTRQDNIAHLDKNSITHNGSYFMPMLKYFSNAKLNLLNSKDDFVYFNIPFAFINYPFQWIYPMWIIAFILFIGLIFIGISKHVLKPTDIAKGFIPFFISVASCGLVCFLLWKSLLMLYPEYNDILHGFTYNGHDYVMAFVLISCAICFYVYEKLTLKTETFNIFIAPLFIWIVINLFLSIWLKGAAFLIIPVFFGLFLLGIYIFTNQTNWFLNFIFSLPALLILVPFVYLFPVGLGLKILFGSCILVALIFTLLIPVFNLFTHKRIWAFVLLLFAVGFLMKAHFNSEFVNGKAKPNSLLYVYDADKNIALWATYDTTLDSWTMNRLGDKPQVAKPEQNLQSKYNSKFTYTSLAPLIDIKKPVIQFLKDSIGGSKRFLKIKIIPLRPVNRYDIFGNPEMSIKTFYANGEKKIAPKSSKFKTSGNKILSYYVINNMPLEMDFVMDAAKNLDMQLIESSYDLMANQMLKVLPRQDWMMPKPFVLTDAIVLKQNIVPQDSRIINDSISN